MTKGSCQECGTRDATPNEAYCFECYHAPWGIGWEQDQQSS